MAASSSSSLLTRLRGGSFFSRGFGLRSYPARGRGRLKQHQIVRMALPDDGNHFDVDLLRCRAVTDVQPWLCHRLPRLARRLKRGAQSVRQPLARELQNVEARLAGDGSRYGPVWPLNCTT